MDPPEHWSALDKKDRIAKVKIHIGDHISEEWCWVTDIIGYDLILGQPWLEQHNPVIQVAERS